MPNIDSNTGASTLIPTDKEYINPFFNDFECFLVKMQRPTRLTFKASQG